MQKHKADFTNTFRFLSEDILSGDDIFKTEEFLIWHKKWKLRLKKESNTFENIKKIMDTNNPRIIPRNHLVEKALKSAEEGDLETFVDFSKIIKNPYSSSIDVPKKYLNPPNDSCLLYTSPSPRDE